MKSAKIEQSPVDGDALVRLLARAKPHPNGAGAGRSPAQTNESLGGEAAPNESLGGEAAPSQASPYDESGISARVRRDSKNTLEQRPMALACGARPMTQIGILGKAIKIYKSWYALCTHCAALVKLDPSLHFFGSDVCCLRCDNLMLRVDAHAHATRDLKKVCRFCGCMDEGRGSVRWRCVKAPLDIAGPNALLPPPLRTVRASLSLRESNPPKPLFSRDAQVYYCPAHYRGWLISAHLALETRVVLSHLAHNARPVIMQKAENAFVAPKRRPKKKRRLKI